MEEHGMRDPRSLFSAAVNRSTRSDQGVRRSGIEAQFGTSLIPGWQPGAVVAVVPVGVQRGLADFGGYGFKGRARFPKLFDFSSRVAPGRAGLGGHGYEDQHDQGDDCGRKHELDEREAVRPITSRWDSLHKSEFFRVAIARDHHGVSLQGGAGGFFD